ncbi:5'-methylthioadenosine/S-adenosylhomocysteine nucleosidase, partial [Streptococcus pyogenes]|uniref:5'-methylthioadenosine/S-adenosylhomocysteine nucleosidase n=1 Tax=Streptococcus pyogenes TaxID=1314 RepID=UPI0021CC56EA
MLDAQEHQVEKKTYYTGRIGKHELIVVQSGVGKVMSAMKEAILVEHFKAQAISNKGSAGAVASHLAIGDVEVADRLVYHDVDATAFGSVYGQMAGQTLYYDCDPHFVAIFKQVLKHEKTKCQVGF